MIMVPGIICILMWHLYEGVSASEYLSYRCLMRETGMHLEFRARCKDASTPGINYSWEECLLPVHICPVFLILQFEP